MEYTNVGMMKTSNRLSVTSQSHEPEPLSLPEAGEPW